MKKIGGNSCVSKFMAFLSSTFLPQGKCLFFAYLFTKFLYVANISLTLWGLSVFLDISPWDYPRKILSGLQFRSELGRQFSGRFPTVTICQYTGEAQVHGKLLRMTGLCVIPFNVYYDKIFAIFYGFLIVLLVLLIVSIFVWLYKCCSSNMFFKKYLDVGFPCPVGSSLKRLNDVATVDLIFVLRLVENNADWLVTYSLVRKLNEKLIVSTKKPDDP